MTSTSSQEPGYRAFLTHVGTLRTAITEPGHLAMQLYAKGLLTDLAHQRANLASLTPLERSQELLSALDGRIASDEGAFDKFLTVLSENPVMEEVCGRLKASRDAFSSSHSMKILPSSPLELYMSYLKEVYTNDSFPTYDKWPHVEGKKFINLSLLSKRKTSPQEAKRYIEAISRGKIPSYTPKRKMEMKNIAKTEDGSTIRGKKRCIFVQGAPGVGKSTFAWKLCRKWGKGKILQQYRLVVLLRLREKRVRETKVASDLFKRCHPTAIEEICQSGGEGVLLVLDGWDELPAESREESFFTDLIRGQELPDATVLVTSRPHASEMIVTECQDRIFQHVEIMGFTQDNVQEYMRSSAGDDARLLHGLQTYTSCYPHIASMMYNPLNAAIVVEVYRNSWNKESSIPKTMTELYSSLIRALLLRYLKEHPVHRKRKWSRKLRCFNDLPSDVYQQLCQISRIAYEGISNKQQVIFSDLPDNFDSLGLMQCVPELYVDEGAALSYNFLHLTIQEFLAAFHLSQQSTEKLMEIFKLHQKTSSYEMVLKFIAGLTNFKDFSPASLHSILIEEGGCSHGHSIPLDCLHFLFEGKESTKVLNTVISEVDFDGDDAIMSPFDCYVLGYVVSHTSCSWTVVLSWSSNIVAKMFAKGTMKDEALCSTLPNVTIFLHYASLQVSALQQLLTAHPSFLSRITWLDLEGNGLDSHLCDTLSQSLPSLLHLQSLNISQNPIGSTVERISVSQPLVTRHYFPSTHFYTASNLFSPPDPIGSLVQLIKSLQSCNILKTFYLSNTGSGLPECTALALWLSSPTCSLEDLDIGGNDLDDEATELVITTLLRNCTLRRFDISDSQIIGDLLTPMLRIPLVKLDLSNCSISSEEICVIAGAMYSNTVLEHLDLSGNPIGDRGAAALSDMLLHNKTLKTLHLNSTSLTAQGTQALLQSLQHNATLSELWLSIIESLMTHDNEASNKCKITWIYSHQQIMCNYSPCTVYSTV